MTPGRAPPPGPHNLRLCLLTIEGKRCPDHDQVCDDVRVQHAAEFRDLEQRRRAWESLAKWTVDRIARARGL